MLKNGKSLVWGRRILAVVLGAVLLASVWLAFADPETFDRSLMLLCPVK